MSDIVYEGKVNIRLSVDVSQPNMFAPPLVKQGDSNTRALVITLTDNSEPIAIPDDATVWLNCRNTADNEKRASVECEINADGTVTGIVPTVVMEAAGIIECDVSVITLSESNETELLKSTLFCLSCERAANKDGTTTEAEDSILTGIASGEITIPAAKGDPGPPGPPGPAGSSVTIINAETVPESANWDGEIPTTYAGQTGEKGEIAFWNGELWYLYNVATLGQTTYYHWDKVAVTEDLEAKMDLAPLNPTAEQIAALPSGQLYSDVNAGTVNIKNGVQLLGVLSNGSNPEYGSTKGELGQISYYAGKMYQCFGLNPQGTAYVWKLMSYADSDVIKARFSTTGPSGDFVITSSTTLYEIGRLFRKYRCVKVEITNQYGTPTGYVCWITTVTGNNYENLSAFMLPSISGTSSPVYERIHFLVQNGDSSDDTLRLVTKYVYPPYEEYYTKTEIDDMIGDIESLLSEV